jgi:hypothetical protein
VFWAYVSLISWVYQMPLPADLLPVSLTVHAPSMYILILFLIIFAICIGHNARLWQTAFGCVKIQKYELNSPSRAIIGSKVTSPFCILASLFLSFLLCIKDSPSMFLFSWADGLHFGFSLSIISCAILQHQLGSRQPCAQSLVQLPHWQVFRSWWISSGSAPLSQFVILISSPTVITWCFDFRHLGTHILLKPAGLSSALRWYHMGSCLLMSSSILNVSRHKLYFFPV